jgi:hypothetical protein
MVLQIPRRIGGFFLWLLVLQLHLFGELLRPVATAAGGGMTLLS